MDVAVEEKTPILTENAQSNVDEGDVNLANKSQIAYGVEVVGTACPNDSVLINSVSESLKADFGESYTATYHVTAEEAKTADCGALGAAEFANVSVDSAADRTVIPQSETVDSQDSNIAVASEPNQIQTTPVDVTTESGHADGVTYSVAPGAVPGTTPDVYNQAVGGEAAVPSYSAVDGSYPAGTYAYGAYNAQYYGMPSYAAPGYPGWAASYYASAIPLAPSPDVLAQFQKELAEAQEKVRIKAEKEILKAQRESQNGELMNGANVELKSVVPKRVLSGAKLAINIGGQNSKTTNNSRPPTPPQVKKSEPVNVFGEVDDDDDAQPVKPKPKERKEYYLPDPITKANRELLEKKRSSDKLCAAESKDSPEVSKNGSGKKMRA